MNCFGELYARYTEKMWELCEQEAYDENRLSCWVDYEEEPCQFCDRHCFHDGTGPGKQVCDSAECIKLMAWYDAPGREGGYKRRQVFKKHFGVHVYKVDKAIRRDAIYTVMLLIESQEQADAGRKRFPVVA